MVERRSPWIDDVSCAWAASPPLVWLPNGPFWHLGLLVLGLGIYALDNMLVTRSFVQIHLHTFLDQHLWNSSNNRPMLTFIPSDARLLHDS